MQDSDPAILTYGQLSDFVGRVKSLAPLSGAADPDITTPAFHLGQRYINTTTNKEFYCVEIPPLGDTGFVWLPVDTTYSNFVGTDGVSAGTAGLVPAPAATDAGKFLKADGTWATAGGGGGGDIVYSGVQTSDSSTGGAIYIGNKNAQQQVIGDPAQTDTHIRYFVALPSSNSDVAGNGAINILGEVNSFSPIAIGLSSAAGDSGVAIGYGANTKYGNSGVAIGRDAATNSYAGSIALGRGATTTRAGEVNVGAGTSGYGYNNTNYRVIGGVHDPVDANDAATKGYVDGKILTNAGAPTTATVGAVGQLLQDSTNGKLYICTVASGGSYTWSEVGSGGGGGSVTVVQTPGVSQTDVMSQDAATKLIFPNYSSSPNVVCIGGAEAYTSYAHLAIGNGARGSNFSVSLGSGDGINVNGARVSSPYGIAIGAGSVVNSNEAIAIGNATVPANARGSIAIGDSSGGNINANGMVDFGTSYTSNGYNSTNYRLITGVHDPQGAHDVATKGYVDSAGLTITMTTVDPGEGQPLGANEFIAVYSAV